MRWAASSAGSFRISVTHPGILAIELWHMPFSRSGWGQLRGLAIWTVGRRICVIEQMSTLAAKSRLTIQSYRRCTDCLLWYSECLAEC